MTLKPTKGYTIVKLDEEKEKKTEAGIYLPDTKKDATHQWGEVVQGGEVFKAGSTVIFKRWAGEEITYKGETLLFLHEDDIIGYEE